MRFELSETQVLDLAPDPSSRKAGQGLGRARGWDSLGQDDGAAWGEIKGSGAAPYRVALDAAGLAAKCTCPSRKFPCKHTLGLMLVLAGEPKAVPAAAPPEWVASWTAGRASRAAAAASPKPVDAAAQARRRDAREKNISDGVAELLLWVSDLLRRGLASARAEGFPFWDRMGARLVDAQAPVLARRVRSLADAAAGENWEERLAEAVGRLTLLAKAWQRLESLPPGMAADVRSAVGIPDTAEAIAACPGTPDDWTVLAQRFEDTPDGLRSRQTWLAGAGTGRMAVLLDFSVGGRPLPPAPAPGQAFRGEIVFHPGGHGCRASLRGQGEPCPPDGFAGASGAEAALHEAAAAVGRVPWAESWPVRILGARAGRGRDPRLVYAEEGGLALPLASRPHDASFAALTAGRPADLFGLWDGSSLEMLACRVDGRLYAAPPAGAVIRRTA